MTKQVDKMMLDALDIIHWCLKKKNRSMESGTIVKKNGESYSYKIKKLKDVKK